MATEPQLQPTLVQGGLDEFLRLEEKIVAVADALRRARERRLQLEQETADWRAKLAAAKQDAARSDKELVGLRKERDEIRRRVEKLIAQLDSLPLE